ncbi:hypothetical protein GLUCORHAEAF1_12150 [Komagataeibacter rhaeticus AF1]|nr:hypothetical protein GLUCORHAEAF1_12150 [Komagataeibacter rhaeticus AF1]
MYCSSGPETSEICQNATSVEIGGNFVLATSLMNERLIDGADQVDFISGAGCQDNAVGLDAFMFAPPKNALDGAVLVDQGAT